MFTRTEINVDPADEIKIEIRPAYHGPFAGDASEKIFISINNQLVVYISGSFKETKCGN